MAETAPAIDVVSPSLRRKLDELSAVPSGQRGFAQIDLDVVNSGVQGEVGGHVGALHADVAVFGALSWNATTPTRALGGRIRWQW